MIKTIFWDFDGVIFDSLKIKGDGFVELFKNYNKADVKAIEKYHYTNGGVSRFDKIKYFYNQILNEDVSKDKVIKLAKIFSVIIENKLFQKANLIKDSVLFIEKNYMDYNFHIVSGAEHNELNDLCKHFEIDKYFRSINGSPTKKDILVQKLFTNYHYNKYEVALIGDAMTDYCVAKKNEIKFYGYNNNKLKKFGNYILKFENFQL